MDRRLLTKTVLATVILALAGITVFAQMRADAFKPQRKDEIVYLPNQKLLMHFTAGMNSIVADLLWLRCVQYTGVEIKESHNFAWLKQMLNTIVKMDPHFADVYRYGGIFLASIKADDSAGLDLLQRGIVARPDVWSLPYEAAMIFLLNRRDEPGSRRVAAYYLAMAVASGKAPKFVADVASTLQGEYNLDDIESEMWTNLEGSDDQMLRDLAARKQQELQIRKNLRTLDDNVERFRQATGRQPTSLEEIIEAGFFGAPAKEAPGSLLNDPIGGKYFLDEEGHAQNTTLLDTVRDKYLNNYRDMVKRYFEEKGAYPPSLDVLVGIYLTEPYIHPYAGKTWGYDPSTGEVSG